MVSKLNTNKYLFINPPFCDYRMAVGGIAHIRGFLINKNIQSSIINLNNQLLESNDLNEKYKGYLIKKNYELSKQKLPGFIGSDIIAKRIISADKDHIGKIVSDQYLLKEIIGSKIDVIKQAGIIGISITYISQIIFSLVLANYIKKRINKNIKIVFGGCSVIWTINDLLLILKDDSMVDYLVVGTGERAFYELTQGSDCNTIPNLIYYDKNNNKYKYSANQHYIENIEKLPIPLYEKKDIPVVFTSRGCYWNKCIFCNFDRNVNRRTCVRSVNCVIETIKTIHKTIEDKDTTYYFTDDSLAAGFIKKFSLASMKNKDLPRSYKVYIRPDQSFNYNILKLAGRSGFGKGGLSLFTIGVETFIPRLQSALNKGLNIADVYKFIDNCDKLGLHVDINIMIGLPTQTASELIEDFDRINKILNIYVNVIFQCKPIVIYEGTDLYYNPSKYQIKINKRQSGSLFNLGYTFTQTRKDAISSMQAFFMFKDFFDKLPTNYQRRFKDVDRMMFYVGT